MKKTILMTMIIMLSLVSACNNENPEKLNQEALSLTSEDVPNWLDKHSISIPNGLANQMDINNYVIEIIEYAKAGIDASVTSYDKTMFFIQDIQEAAGYSFVNRREAMFLEKEDIQSWLKKHKISIPGDLKEEIDVDEFVLKIIKEAQQGIDSSIGFSYDQTIEFIQEIQSAAGYSFNT
jgi:5-formaminoimidazole-4-carboxamide-1-beta-D-ribofuranosyl 5'-monophosphate synthetase